MVLCKLVNKVTGRLAQDEPMWSEKVQEQRWQIENPIDPEATGGSDESDASGCYLKRSENGGLIKVPMTQSLSLKPVVGFQPSLGLYRVASPRGRATRSN